MTRRAISLAFLALALALPLAACGDDSPSKAASDSSTTTTAKKSTTTTADGDADTSTTEPNFSGKGSGDFCRFAREIENNNELLSGDLTKERFEDFNKVLDEAIDSAPGEIKDDFKTLGEAFKAIGDLYAKYDYDQAKITAAIQKDPTIAAEFTSAMSGSDFAAASTRITAYMAQVCGIDDSTTSTTP